MTKRALLVVLLLSYISVLWATVPVNGSFTAHQSCPAYLSKNHKTNPSQKFTRINEEYSIVAVNRKNNADWYQINITDKHNPLRWVHRSCGEGDYDIQPEPSCNRAAGNADSYVLAVSWQPAFCETYGYEAGKAECRQMGEKSFARHHLTLHGLWPNQNACGRSYGFCEVSSRNDHCAYPALELTPTVSGLLKQYMPSYASGSCLERHEWNKHGTCQLQTMDNYFNLALSLAREVDASHFADTIRQYQGGKVARKQLEKAAETSFGKGSASKIYFACSRGKLVDIFIQLPRQINAEDGLAALMRDVDDGNKRTGCPTMITISDFPVSDSSH